MSSVCVQGLTVRFGRHEVLRGLDLQIDAGEFVVLLGPSGCGKSTLLHAIAGLVDVQAGAVAIGGREMTHAEPSERGVGMVFQSYALYPTMTVERNLSFGLRAAGRPRAEIAERVARTARLLQLEDLLGRKPAQLSGGQRQRVAIGRALVREASVFLLDEPLSNLDAQLRAELRRELKLLHRQLGATMIHVTHDQVEAMTLASRIVLMRDGRIQQCGTPAEVYERPANRFVAGFLGSPPMNFIEGSLRVGPAGVGFAGSGVLLDLARYRFQGTPADGRDAVLGVRPEHCTLYPEQDAPSGSWPGTVRLVEPLGNQQVIWVDAGGASIAVLADGAARFGPDDAVRLGVALGHVALFGGSSGERL